MHMKAFVPTHTQFFTLSFNMQYNDGRDLAVQIVSVKFNATHMLFHILFSKMTSKPPGKPSAKEEKSSAWSRVYYQNYITLYNQD